VESDILPPTPQPWFPRVKATDPSHALTYTEVRRKFSGNTVCARQKGELCQKSFTRSGVYPLKVRRHSHISANAYVRQRLKEVKLTLALKKMPAEISAL